MEGGLIVALALLLDLAQLAEVLGSLRDNIVEELEVDVARVV